MASGTTGIPAGSRGKQFHVDHYTLLIFDGTDEVIGTQGLRTTSFEEAQRMARHILRTRLGAVGYQLWREGVRLDATFPPPVAPGEAAVAMIEGWRKRN